MNYQIVNDNEIFSLEIEDFGRLPGMQYLLDSEGRIMFRYAVKDENEYPGFDGLWREMSEGEQRETLRMGGRVAEWLKVERHLNGS